MTGPTQETNALNKLAKLVVKAKINRLVAGDDLDRRLAVVEQVIDRKQRQGNAAERRGRLRCRMRSMGQQRP